MFAHLEPLERLESRDTPAPLTPGPAAQPQAGEFNDGGPQDTTPAQTSTPGRADDSAQGTTVELDDSNNDANAAVSIAFPAGNDALAESGVASTRFATDGFAAAGSPTSLSGATGPTAESASSALVQSTGFGPSLAPAVDRLLATARPRDELSGLGFRGRIVFQNSNSPERSATLPGPREQNGIFLLSGGNGGQASQAAESTAAPAGARVALTEIALDDGEADPEAEGDGVEE